MNHTMLITVNGHEESVPVHSTLSSLVVLFKEEHPELITELNGRFVHPHDYGSRRVDPGDRVEFINAAFGG